MVSNGGSLLQRSFGGQIISASDSVSTDDDVLDTLAGLVMAEAEFARFGYSLVVVE